MEAESEVSAAEPRVHQYVLYYIQSKWGAGVSTPGASYNVSASSSFYPSTQSFSQALFAEPFKVKWRRPTIFLSEVSTFQVPQFFSAGAKNTARKFILDIR